MSSRKSFFFFSSRLPHESSQIKEMFIFNGPRSHQGMDGWFRPYWTFQSLFAQTKKVLQKVFVLCVFIRLK
jgi:hypothetical protein